MINKKKGHYTQYCVKRGDYQYKRLSKSHVLTKIGTYGQLLAKVSLNVKVVQSNDSDSERNLLRSTVEDKNLGPTAF